MGVYHILKNRLLKIIIVRISLKKIGLIDNIRGVFLWTKHNIWM